MKICFFNTTKTWGGGENWHLNTAQAFRARGHEVVIVATKNGVLSQRASDKGLTVRHFAIHNLSFLNPFKRYTIYKYFVKETFDTVIFNSSNELKVAVSAAVSAKISRVIYRRGSAIPTKNSFLNRLIFKKLTDIIANSEATKKSILQNNYNLFPADKIVVIYNGIDVSAFEQKEAPKNDVPVVGNLGRCVYQKGQDLLLHVVHKLKQRGVACRFKVGGDGPLLADLKMQAAHLGIADMVEFTGFVDDSKKFLQSVDIFVLSSRGEGFGYVLAEAMASAKPVVVFDVSSSPEVVANEQTGILVPFANVDLFADAIEKLVNNPTLRETFGKKGMDVVTEKFSIEQNENKLIDFLTK